MDKRMVDAMSKLPSKPLRSITILVVDDDPTCLSIVAALLKSWNYEVVTVKHAIDALCALRLKTGYFDLVVTDIHMPDMNGFELHKIIKEEFNLPVVFMSADDKDSVIFEGLARGAACFIVKPVTPADLKNLWQYVVAKKAGKGINVGINDQDQSRPVVIPRFNHQINTSVSNHAPAVSSSSSPRQVLPSQKAPAFNTANNNNNGSSAAAAVASVAANRGKESSKRRGPMSKFVASTSRVMNDHDSSSASAPKKIKIVWTNALHNQFLEAVRTLGLDRAVPKKILELMNVPGLTRENVASHLQKYRIFLKRVSEASCRIQTSAERRLSQKSFESMFDYQGSKPFEIPSSLFEKIPTLDSPAPVKSSSSNGCYSISQNMLNQSSSGGIRSNYGKSRPLSLTGTANNNLYKTDDVSGTAILKNKNGKNPAKGQSGSSTNVVIGGNPNPSSSSSQNPNPSYNKVPANITTNGYSNYNSNMSSSNNKMASTYAGFRLETDGRLIGFGNSDNVNKFVVDGSHNITGDNSGTFIVGQSGISTPTLGNHDQSPQNPNVSTTYFPNNNNNTIPLPNPNNTNNNNIIMGNNINYGVFPNTNMIIPPNDANNNIIMVGNNNYGGNDGCDFGGGLINNGNCNGDLNSIFLNTQATNYQVQPPNMLAGELGVHEPTNNIPFSTYHLGETSQQNGGHEVASMNWDNLENTFPSVLDTEFSFLGQEDEEFLRSVLGYEDGGTDASADQNINNFGYQ